MRRTIILALMETAAYTAIAVLMVRFVFYLCYVDPVNFVRMITEDQWGEYATAVAYGICSLLLWSFQVSSGHPQDLVFNTREIDR